MLNWTELGCQSAIAYICLTLGTHKALKDYTYTLDLEKVRKQKNRVSTVSQKSVNSRDSINTDYESEKSVHLT